MEHSVTIQTQHESIVVAADSAESLLDVIRKAGFHLNAACGGGGRCGKCVITVTPATAADPKTDDELRFTTDEPSQRLACRAHARGDLTVDLPADTIAPQVFDTAAKGGSIRLPASGTASVVALQVELPRPNLDDQRSFAQRIRDQLQDDAGTGLAIPLPIADAAQELLETSDGRAEVRILDAGRGSHVVGWSRPDGTPPLGVAVDIGTTTVAAYLVDCATHTVMESLAEPNAQSVHGADVVTRISAQSAGAPLTALIRDQLSHLVVQLCRRANVRPDRVDLASVVGNTTMIHLLAGLDASGLGRSPFIPVTVDALWLRPEEIELPINPVGAVVVLPGISAYVGADIVADLIACGMTTDADTSSGSAAPLPSEGPGPSLLIDVGTNGEIVLSGGRGVIACSTAAGPAFEGASIRCGSGGIPGAIDSVTRRDDEIVVTTVMGAAPWSICGTGLIDLIAMLLDDGVIDETGRFDVEMCAPDLRSFYKSRLTDDGRGIVLADEGGSSLTVNQDDIRQVQLAKGAIAAGVATLLEETDTDPSSLRAVFLAGGFGAVIRPEAAARIGLLPSIPPDRVRAIGNAAGAGAGRILVDRSALADAERVSRHCTYLELSGSARFQELFVEAMLFPSRDAGGE